MENNELIMKVDESINLSDKTTIDDTINLPEKTVIDTIQESLNDEMFKTYLNLKEDHKTVIKFKLEGLNNTEISKLMKVSNQWIGVLLKNINVRKILATLSEIQLNDYTERLNARKFIDYEWALNEYKEIYKKTDDERLKKSILDSIVKECKPENSSVQPTTNNFIDKNLTLQLPK